MGIFALLGTPKSKFWLAGVGRYLRNVSASKIIQANAKEECRAKFEENGKYYNYKSADIQIISYLNKYLKTRSNGIQTMIGEIDNSLFGDGECRRVSQYLMSFSRCCRVTERV